MRGFEVAMLLAVALMMCFSAYAQQTWFDNENTNHQIADTIMKSTEEGTLDVRKIAVSGSVAAEQVASLMEDNAIEWHRLEQAPWADRFPYRPQVQFA